jgi:hypothetical protein
MLIDGQALEVADNRQLTFRADGFVGDAWISPDGKYVVYATIGEFGRKLCLVRASGGKPSVLMQTSPLDPSAKEIWLPGSTHMPTMAAWSPDSRLIAYNAGRLVPGEPNRPEESWVIIRTIAGLVRCSFLLPEETRLRESPMWSPDGKRLATTFRVIEKLADENLQITEKVLVLNTLTSTMDVRSPQSGRLMHLEGWDKGSDAVRCVIVDPQDVRQLCEIRLDGKLDRVIVAQLPEGRFSPDGLLYAQVEGGEIKVRKCATGEEVQVMKADCDRFLSWLPDGKKLMYSTMARVRDEEGRRGRTLNSIWIASLDNHRLNRMCVSLDAEMGTALNWSSDGMKLAYISQGRAYVAELVRRPMSLLEKNAAGIPLDEQEQKALRMMLMNSAKQIGAGMHMYMADWDDKQPGSDSLMQDLLPYLRRDDLFFLPGTEQPIFQYFPGWTYDNPAETIVMTLDAGYGWQIALYADGHVKVIPKQ